MHSGIKKIEKAEQIQDRATEETHYLHIEGNKGYPSHQPSQSHPLFS